MNTHPRLRWLIPALCLPLTAAMAQEVPPASSLPGSHRGATGPAPMETLPEVEVGSAPTRFEPAAVSFVGTQLDRLNTP